MQKTHSWCAAFDVRKDEIENMRASSCFGKEILEE